MSESPIQVPEAWDLHPTPRVAFGVGSARRFVAGLGPAHRLILVLDADTADSGPMRAIEGAIHATGAEVVLTLKPSRTNSALSVERAYARAQHLDASRIVAVGGAESIILGRWLSALLAHGGRVHDYAERRTFAAPGLPWSAVPNASGILDALAVTSWMADPETGMVHSLHSDQFLPDDTVVDPTLSLCLPATEWTKAAFDAMGCVIEVSALADESAAASGAAAFKDGRRRPNAVAHALAVEAAQSLATALNSRESIPLDLQATTALSRGCLLAALSSSWQALSITALLKAALSSRHVDLGVRLPWAVALSVAGPSGPLAAEGQSSLTVFSDHFEFVDRTLNQESAIGDDSDGTYADAAELAASLAADATSEATPDRDTLFRLLELAHSLEPLPANQQVT